MKTIEELIGDILDNLFPEIDGHDDVKEQIRKEINALFATHYGE